mmetsp:Transcript_13253/g.48272  ORF Transcript_13253/g.48272 Transcript_13253/m.48272 type:complete len:116 (+) Transcript_13253:380-727(+)
MFLSAAASSRVCDKALVSTLQGSVHKLRFSLKVPHFHGRSGCLGEPVRSGLHVRTPRAAPGAVVGLPRTMRYRYLERIDIATEGAGEQSVRLVPRCQTPTSRRLRKHLEECVAYL